MPALFFDGFGRKMGGKEKDREKIGRLIRGDRCLGFTGILFGILVFLAKAFSGIFDCRFARGWKLNKMIFKIKTTHVFDVYRQYVSL